MIRALQEHVEERRHRRHRKTRERAPDDEIAKCAALDDHPDERAKIRHRRRHPRHVIHEASRRLAQDEIHQCCRDDAGNAQGIERVAPAISLRDRAGHQRPEERARRRAQHDERHGRGAPFRRKVIGDQRACGGQEARLPHSHAEARKHELEVVLRDSAQRGGGRPDGRDGNDDPEPVEVLGEAAEGDAETRIQQREGQPLQHAEVEVGELQVDLYRLRQHREHRAIREVEAADQEHREEEQAPIAGPEESLLVRRVLAHASYCPRA